MRSQTSTPIFTLTRAHERSPCDLPSSLWLELLGVMGREGGPKHLGVGPPAVTGKRGRPPHTRPPAWGQSRHGHRLGGHHSHPSPASRRPVKEQGLGEDHCPGSPRARLDGDHVSWGSELGAKGVSYFAEASLEAMTGRSPGAPCHPHITPITLPTGSQASTHPGCHLVPCWSVCPAPGSPLTRRVGSVCPHLPRGVLERPPELINLAGVVSPLALCPGPPAPHPKV